MRSSWSFVLVVSLLACGGSAVPPPSSAPAASAAPSATPPVATAPPADSAGTKVATEPPRSTLDSQRGAFIADCVKKMNAPDYCACTFDLLRSIFKDSDLGQEMSDQDPRVVALKAQTQSQCAPKVPEEVVQASFMESCLTGDQRREPYCKCAWPALRKTLATADFLGDLQSPRVDEAKKAMAAACKGTFPVAVAQAGFVSQCSKGDPAKAKVCDCVWKKLSARFSPEEIVSGIGDLGSVPGLDQCRK